MKIIFVLALVAMVFVYPMYFFSLISLKKIIIEIDPSLWERSKAATAVADFQVAYRFLRLSKGDVFDGRALPSAVVGVKRRANRLLYAGAGLFLLVLFSGLIDAATY